MKKVDVFGKKRLADFYVDPDYININHGSYGYAPRSVIAAKRKLQEQMEFNGEKWMRFDVQRLLNQTRQVVAQKVQCKTENLFIIQNATDGINSLVKSLPWKAGETIAILSFAYACVRKTVEWVRDRYGIKILNIPITLEDLQSMQKVQAKIQDTVNAYPQRISLAIIDHISSIPAVVLPVDSLSQFFKQKGIPVFVDGAHAVCQVEIDLSQLEVDGYFSNFHKWGFAPKNAAFLYISDRFLDIVRPALTGNFRGEGVDRQFFWTGTRDHTSYLVIKDGLDYIQSFGPNRMQQYNRSLSLEAANKMAEIWKTKKLTEDVHMMAYLNNVEVPCDDISLCLKIADKMQYEYNCYPVFYKFDNKVFIRISVQLYNELSDYVYAANLFLQLLNAAQEEMKE